MSKSMPKIVKIEKLPSTNNSWGFGGATEKVRYVMDNGDIWVSGNAHYRHLPSVKYIQMKRGDPDYTGGVVGAAVDDASGNPKKFIENYYKKHPSDGDQSQT
jgi:hypothetical protein